MYKKYGCECIVAEMGNGKWNIQCWKFHFTIIIISQHRYIFSMILLCSMRKGQNYEIESESESECV